MAFKLPELAYSYDALEPYIDAQTMKIHHTKHHKAYCDKLNEAIKETPLAALSIEKILAKGAKALPDEVRNNGGGFYNHQLFWKMLTPEKDQAPSKALAEAIKRSFSGFDKFKNAFNEAATSHFGSGWTWLLLDDGKLKIESTDNQDSPLMEKKICVLGIDIWEHAYYLKYKNNRADYLTAWWNIINWDYVSETFEAALNRS